jgi:conjugative relaxase-like TrwC/TraI family protein
VRATLSAISGKAIITTRVGLSKASGTGAALNCLALKGEVTSEDFEAARQGLNPQTGEFLRQRHSADRIASNGAEQCKARSLYDMTFSAPKSVSVMAIVGGDDRLLAVHATAVREALEEAEKYSATRVRLAGLNENRATGNWIVASYTHDTSRQLDPHLHTHAVAANLTYDGSRSVLISRLSPSPKTATSCEAAQSPRVPHNRDRELDWKPHIASARSSSIDWKWAACRTNSTGSILPRSPH